MNSIAEKSFLSGPKADGGEAAANFLCIVADPPWDYKTPGQIGKTLEHRPNRDKGESKHGAGSVARYGSMSTDDLCALPVIKWSAANAHLYLWTTNGFMEDAYRVARAWGYTPKTIVTWTKIRQADGKPSMKMGYYFRGATEHCLFCVRGSLRLRGPAAPTAILSPRLPHSEKPDSFFQMVEVQSPGPYLEMFARRKREGWASWGNEIESDVDIHTGAAAPSQPLRNELPPASLHQEANSRSGSQASARESVRSTGWLGEAAAIPTLNGHGPAAGNGDTEEPTAASPNASNSATDTRP